ncbi:hypothetical protein FRX31_002342 [Thalictrum thalictroides]|uniref:RNase H type-1 domain-containing protein n=1 Tax=Thalictrum thalictroides TaxID=46969 RepID=A0A7J6XE37_THATH|nr:hypothetical protein FRX31_002342 [Thalictrum thalictroides]
MYQKENLRLISAKNNTSLTSIWIPPATGRTKLNVYIAYTNVATDIGIGYICRDSAGKFIFAVCDTDASESSDEAECRGLLTTGRQGVGQQLTPVEIESDSKGANDHL